MTTPKDLREKVARAIARARHGEAEEHFWLAYVMDAEAALAVVRAELAEPSEAMLRAGHHEEDQCAIHNYGGSPTVEDVWAVMLAASPLAEPGA